MLEVKRGDAVPRCERQKLDLEVADERLRRPCLSALDHDATRHARNVNSGQDQVNIAELVPAVTTVERGTVGTRDHVVARDGFEQLQM